MYMKIDIEKVKLNNENVKYEKMKNHPSLKLDYAQTVEESQQTKEQIRLLDEYHSRKIKEITEMIDEYRYHYTRKMSEKDLDLDKLKVEQQRLDKELELNKSALSALTIDQRKYYIGLLSQGYDVRIDGLVWIVKRLVELNTNIEKVMFPKFLDDDQMDYIINLAYSYIELAQLKIILQILKKRQKSMRSVDSQMVSMMNTTNDFSQANQTGILIFNTNKESKEETSAIRNIKERIKSKTNNLTRKSVELFNTARMTDDQLHSFEEIYIEAVVEELRLKLKEYNRTHDISCIKNFNVTSFINTKSNNYSPVYFKEILAFRNKVLEFEKEIDEIVLTEQKFFREKFDSLKLMNPKHSFQYDLTYAAMFGNGIIV